MFWQRKGICGLELKRQTQIIALCHCTIASFLIVYGFVLIETPSKFIHSSNVSTFIEEHNNNSAISDKTVIDDNLGLRSNIIRHIQDEGVLTSIGSLISFILASFLFYGASKNQAMWMIPWIAQQLIELTVAFFFKVIRGIKYFNSTSILYWIGLMMFYYISIIFIYAVMSHFVLIRTMKKHSREVINSVMQGEHGYSNGFKFEVLSEEMSSGKELDLIQRTNTSMESIEKRDKVMYFSLE
ncbi:unnamed protein product [Lepeophtheirus salmonis]|uniref:(salmon louse) hypothetical protein n=1 Tax=Lepeophtheirus salmonis TaxID=72036 RepID=A0A7R8HCH8_LEPSM|nr:uncharacterized protein LOC121123195 [Lepeophtheirus salmonis]CAB4068816.1 unnamed protein product [Lepeophtheirus salmonis]CAF3016331.1 unnamed protein product [Lepeophtheirus salmonis]